MLHKGSSLVIIGLTILCAALVAHASGTPVVISATRVPVLGGIVHIYGHGFGTDASLISVHVEDAVATAGTVACTNVQMVTPDRVIACSLNSVGTGKSMHITVSISTDDNGSVETVTNDDANTAFSREVPVLDSLTYSVEQKTIVLQGNNFGFDVSKVTVLLAGDDYPVLAVTNNAITLRFLRKRRTDGYVIPSTSFARVTVDKQTNVANMTTTRASLVEESAVENDSAGPQSGGVDKGKVAGLAAGGALLFVVACVVVGVFVMKKNKRDEDFKKNLPSPSSSLKPSKKPETGRTQLETGRSLNFSLIGNQAELGIDPEAPAVMQEMEHAPTEAQENAERSGGEEERGEGGEEEEGTVVVEHHSDDDEHHSLEEIDLRDDIYEKNGNISDSSFSESSEEEEEEEEEGDDFESDRNSSNFSAEFSDASPVQSPGGEKRQQLQMSSEYPNPAMSILPSSSRIEQAPSPPVLLSTRALPPSPLRRSLVIPPSLSLDDTMDSDGSPLPSPRNISPISKKGKKSKKAAKRGMIRVPSSRLASTAMRKNTQNAFDSPQL